MGVWVACECRPVEQPANLMDDLLGLSTASASAPAASDPFGRDEHSGHDEQAECGCECEHECGSDGFHGVDGGFRGFIGFIR